MDSVKQQPSVVCVHRNHICPVRLLHISELYFYSLFFICISYFILLIWNPLCVLILTSVKTWGWGQWITALKLSNSFWISHWKLLINYSRKKDFVHRQSTEQTYLTLTELTHNTTTAQEVSNQTPFKTSQILTTTTLTVTFPLTGYLNVIFEGGVRMSRWCSSDRKWTQTPPESVSKEWWDHSAIYERMDTLTIRSLQTTRFSSSWAWSLALALSSSLSSFSSYCVWILPPLSLFVSLPRSLRSPHCRSISSSLHL